jgi:hypothetical protein
MVKEIKSKEDFAALVDSEGDEIDLLMQRSVRDALRRHKQLGQSVVVWQDGQMRILSPEEIVVPDEEEELPGRVPVGASTTNGAH